MYFSSNFKFLRKRKSRSQEAAAIGLGIKRSSINNYENGYALPGIDMLPAISKYFGISIDSLINEDLSNMSEMKLRELELGFSTYISGSKLRILATTVDSKNNENIELVPHKARAGYTAGYNDPEFISALPTFQLPFLSKERKYRTFQISGDSMLPILDKSFVTAQYVDNWNEIKDGRAYILLTQDDGIVFKVVYNHIKDKKKLLLKSLNFVYEPYEVNIGDIKEVWEFINYISTQVPEPLQPNDEVNKSVTLIQEEMKKIAQVLQRKPQTLLKRKPFVR
ncbi:MAG: helix-turn-helix domain-containing protein [Bacteroidia bacterium]|nr:helix-turn-helix domain-containing protein [Bacteroidia bacterium]